jgi:hypothetical protein
MLVVVIGGFAFDGRCGRACHCRQRVSLLAARAKFGRDAALAQGCFLAAHRATAISGEQ